MGIPLETGQKQYSVDYKLETYLKISRYRKFLDIFDLWDVKGKAMVSSRRRVTFLENFLDRPSSSVVDPWHFDTDPDADPDPRIRTSF